MSLDDDDAELRSAGEQKSADLALLLDAAPTPVRDPLVGKEVTPVTLDDGQLGPIPKVDKMQAVRDATKARLLLMGVVGDPSLNQGVGPPTLTPVSLLMVGQSCASRGDMTSTIMSGLRSTCDTFQQSRDYACKKISFPGWEDVIKAFAGQGQFHAKKLESIGDKNVDGLTFCHFLPDNSTTKAQKARESNRTHLEHILDETPENRTKKSTDFTPVDKIGGLADVSTALSNVLGLLATAFQFDPQTLAVTAAQTQTPLLAKYTLELLEALESAECKDFKGEKKGTTDEVKLAYYIVGSVSTIFMLFASSANDIVQQTNALSGRWDDVAIKLYKRANKAYAVLMENIDAALDGNIPVPESTLWNNSKEKAHDERIQELLLKQRLGIAKANQGTKTERPMPTTPGGGGGGGGTDTKGGAPPSTRQKLHNDPPNLGDDGRDGYIITPPGTSVCLPTELNNPRPGNGFALCWVFYRKGTKCSHNQGCNRSHAHPLSLPATEGKILWDWMKSNDKGFSWNTDLVNVDEMKKKYAKANS